LETGIFTQMVVCLVIGYILGSVPSGLWIVKAVHHIDIREYGSKNIGATNVYRTVGPATALVVFACDVAKGILACYLAQHLYGVDYMTVLSAAGAIFGHNCSLFLHFKGGKGVATGLGILSYLMPEVSALSLGLWFVVVAITKYVSLGSILASIVPPVLAWYFGYPISYIVLSTVCGLFIVIKHKDNIIRLLHGNESKIKAGNAKNLH